MVDDSGKYPMISDDSLLLPPGMTSYVSIVATDVTSDDGIRSIDPGEIKFCVSNIYCVQGYYI